MKLSLMVVLLPRTSMPSAAPWILLFKNVPWPARAWPPDPLLSMSQFWTTAPLTPSLIKTVSYEGSEILQFFRVTLSAAMVTDPLMSSPSTTVPGVVIVRLPDGFRVTLEGTPVVIASGNIVATSAPFHLLGLVAGDLNSRLVGRFSNSNSEGAAML